jgi:hypothetical protein
VGRIPRPTVLILCAVRLLWFVGNLADWLEVFQLTRIAPVESFTLCQIFFPLASATTAKQLLQNETNVSPT